MLITGDGGGGFTVTAVCTEIEPPAPDAVRIYVIVIGSLPVLAGYTTAGDAEYGTPLIDTEVKSDPLHVNVKADPAYTGFGNAKNEEMDGGAGGGGAGAATTVGVFAKKVWVFDPFPALIRNTPCSLWPKSPNVLPFAKL